MVAAIELCRDVGIGVDAGLTQLGTRQQKARGRPLFDQLMPLPFFVEITLK
jgi:hypothetical protein